MIMEIFVEIPIVYIIADLKVFLDCAALSSLSKKMPISLQQLQKAEKKDVKIWVTLEVNVYQTFGYLKKWQDHVFGYIMTWR